MAQHKKTYRPPTMRNRSLRGLWRELGPAQALTSIAPNPGGNTGSSTNPLRIPPTQK